MSHAHGFLKNPIAAQTISWPYYFFSDISVKNSIANCVRTPVFLDFDVQYRRALYLRSFGLFRNIPTAYRLVPRVHGT